MQREFGDLQNLHQDLWSFRGYCGLQTLFAWDLDNTYTYQFYVHYFMNKPNDFAPMWDSSPHRLRKKGKDSREIIP